MNKIVLSLLGLIALFLLCAYLYFANREYVVTIPQETIVEKLNEKLPLTKTYLLFFDLTIENPRVDLGIGENRIGVGMDLLLNIRVKGGDKPLGGSVDVSGTIKYSPEEGAFYLAEPEIESLSIQGLPEKHKSKVSTIVKTGLTKFYSSRPIYKLKSSDVKQATAKLVLKNLEVQDESLRITLGL